MAFASVGRRIGIHSDYITTVEQHTVDVRKDKEKFLAAYCQANMNLQNPEIALKVAKRIIEGKQLTPNFAMCHNPMLDMCGNPRSVMCHNLSSAGVPSAKTLPPRPERILMLAFPVDQTDPKLPVEETDHRDFNYDRKARLLQNKNFIRILRGEADDDQNLEELLKQKYETLESKYSKKYEDVLFRESVSYSLLGDCGCKLGWNSMENIEDLDDLRITLHDFLHHKCSNSMIAHIIFNCHGSELGSLIFHDKQNVWLDQIIHDLSQCYEMNDSAGALPVIVYIVFAQCYGGPCEYAGHSSIRSSQGKQMIRVVSLVDIERTYDLGDDMHIELEDYAESMKKERVERQREVEQVFDMGEQECAIGKPKKDQEAEAFTSEEGKGLNEILRKGLKLW